MQPKEHATCGYGLWPIDRRPYPHGHAPTPLAEAHSPLKNMDSELGETSVQSSAEEDSSEEEEEEESSSEEEEEEEKSKVSFACGYGAH